MKELIITGYHGQLGTAINRLFESSTEYHLVNTDVEELDITSVDKVLALAREVKPYAIINCAAYTAVDAQEKDIDLSYRINAIGARNLAIAATETNAKIIHISTDYVFPGTSERPLTEFDPTGPVSVYGKTKLAGENFVRDFSDRFFILRTAWLYGVGKNFVRTMLSLSETHEEVTVVDDQFGSPTSTTELAKAIGCLLPTDNYGLFHATCDDSTNWFEFTKEIFRQAGKETKVLPTSSAEYAAAHPDSAPRPHYSILDNYMLRLTTDFTFADWKSALTVYMNDMGYAKK